MWRFRWWRDARPHTKRTRRERETVKQLWNTIVTKITIIHVQCVKNNFKQPFQVLWGLPRSLLIRKPVVSTQTPFSQTTQPWLISLTSSIYEFWHEHERHFEHVLCFFKPSTWNILHLDWNNLYRSRNDFVSKRPLFRPWPFKHSEGHW